MLQEALEEWDDGEGDDHPSFSLDLMFDPWMTLQADALEGTVVELTKVAVEALSPAKRRSRTEIINGVRAMIPTILANLMVLHQERPRGSRLVVPFDHRKRTRHDRHGFRKLPEVVNALAASGHIKKHEAVFRQKRTTIEAVGELKQVLLAPGITLEQVGRAEGEELIVLTARPERRWVRGIRQPNVLVDYEDTPETIALRKEMEELNDFLSSHTVTLEGDPTPAFRLVRQFTLRSHADPIRFQSHGRLYGGFWMNLKATERHRIRVNGEPVADLDFSNMFPRLAYHHVGQVPPEGDLYAVPGLESHRAGAKAGLSALLSYPNRMKNLPSRLKALLPEGWNASRLRDAVAQHHPHLSPCFEKDLGFDLMFTESRILLAALRELMEHDIPALPMHDGIMVQASKVDTAKGAMGNASMRVVGVELPIDRKE